MARIGVFSPTPRGARRSRQQEETAPAALASISATRPPRRWWSSDRSQSRTRCWSRRRRRRSRRRPVRTSASARRDGLGRGQPTARCPDRPAASRTALAERFRVFAPIVAATVARPTSTAPSPTTSWLRRRSPSSTRRRRFARARGPVDTRRIGTDALLERCRGYGPGTAGSARLSGGAAGPGPPCRVPCVFVAVHSDGARGAVAVARRIRDDSRCRIAA